MLVDMHVHEKTFSSDSFLSLETIVERARLRGLDAVCITDHDSMGLKGYAEEYSEKTGFPIFVGVEYFSLWGDITAWGIDEFPDRRDSALDFIAYVNKAKGFCAACHPFRNNNRGFEDRLSLAKGLGGVEVLNGSTDMEANRLALRYCRELGLKAIGASDAHVLDKLACYVTYLPEKVFTLADFVEELRTLDTSVGIWNGISYDIVDEF